MARKYIDCREHLSVDNTITIAISAHGLQDGSELREEMKNMFKGDSPNP